MDTLVFMEDVTCRYGGNASARPRIALPNINVTRGNHTLLLGPSGSGKTTLTNCIAGLQVVQSGRIEVAGADMVSMSIRNRDQLRGTMIGMVMQRLHLISAMTIRANLQLAQRLASRRVDNPLIERLTEALGIVDKLDRFPHQLSQGESQRAAIARALVNKPALLLADEPTSALDDKNCSAAISLLLDQAESHGATLIVATHDDRIKSRFANIVLLGAA
ncbi:MAG: ATP-binding cassette domain-containing protein [Rhodocyclaceae bacterium]|nr:ATP-binding cassette domain-containing protein [Rhodocyclaceae bacterium]